jgi:hypothetical protein
MEAVTLLCLGAVLAAVGWRLVRGWPHRRGLRVVVAFGAVLALLAGVAWARSGPFAPGWSKRAQPRADVVDVAAERPSDFATLSGTVR